MEYNQQTFDYYRNNNCLSFVLGKAVVDFVCEMLSALRLRECEKIVPLQTNLL